MHKKKFKMKHISINKNNIGLPPGTPVYIGDKPVSSLDITVLKYNQSQAEIQDIPSVDELHEENEDFVLWINIIGLRDIDAIKKIAAMYDIHPLTVEDILNTRQQPKMEVFDNYFYYSFKSIQQNKNFQHAQKKGKRLFDLRDKLAESPDEFIIEQISIIKTRNTLISFQEIPGDPFDGVRRRILENHGRIRKMGSSYLAYSLIDAVVDEYYFTLAHLEDDIENYEERAIDTSDEAFMSEIQDTKKHLLHIKRAMLPLRDNVLQMSHQHIVLLGDELKPFFQDLKENLNNAIETVENYRDWLSNIMEVNLSVLSYQMNKVMKILAIVSSIFIPLTFIAGVYGMNFEAMPELSKPWGYPAILCVMGTIAITMAIFFKKRHWF